MNIGSSTSVGTDYSRITGLATGMDTDAMVKQAVAGEMLKIDSTLQSKQILEWQQEAYLDIINDLKNFNNSFLEFTAPLDTNMILSSAYSGVKAISSSETKLTATAYGGAMKGTYNIEVVNIAESAKQQSIKFDSASQSTVLSSLADSSGNAVADGSIKITINDTVFDVNMDSTKSIGEFVNLLKSTTNSDGKVLGNLINVSFSELTGKFTIESKETGEVQKLKIEGSAADQLGISTKDQNGAAVEITGSDATFNIIAPGQSDPAVVTRASNKFTIDNISYDLSGASSGDQLTLTVKADATTNVDKFKKLIEKYNALIEKINSKIKEKKEYNYKPLTDTQKKDMSEDEIKKWEEQAKKGLLARESNLSNLLMKVREIMNETVVGAGISLAEMGIKTSSNYRDGGKLEIDEAKLKDALENKGDLVQKLFTQSSSEANKKGILIKLKDAINVQAGNDGLLIKKAGYKDSQWATDNLLSKSINEKNKAIKDMERRMYDKQERYYKMFAALEKNMNKLNSQSNWLYSQMGTA